jgi:hypothetical protein
MGEMADMALEEAEDFESARLEWRMGNLTAEQAFELGIIDAEGHEIQLEDLA